MRKIVLLGIGCLFIGIAFIGCREKTPKAKSSDLPSKPRFAEESYACAIPQVLVTTAKDSTTPRRQEVLSNPTVPQFVLIREAERCEGRGKEAESESKDSLLSLRSQDDQIRAEQSRPAEILAYRAPVVSSGRSSEVSRNPLPSGTRIRPDGALATILRVLARNKPAVAEVDVEMMPTTSVPARPSSDRAAEGPELEVSRSHDLLGTFSTETQPSSSSPQAVLSTPSSVVGEPFDAPEIGWVDPITLRESLRNPLFR